MKKILLSFFLLAAVLSSSTSRAQCDLQFNNLVITPAGSPVVISSSKCQYTFNAEFDISTNTGFKYLFFHSWLAADYPSPSIFNCSNSNATNPGTSTQLGTLVDDIGKSFLDIGFVNLNTVTFPTGTPVNVTAYFATTYLHDNTVVLTQPGSGSPGLTAVITRTSSSVLHFVVSNIRIIVNQSCGSILTVKTDIWGSNSNSVDPKAQCYICGLSQSFNFTTVSLSKTCAAAPFQYQIGITTQSPTDLNLVYRLYADDLDHVKEPGTDDPLIFTSSTITINSSTSPPYSSGLLDLPFPYCCIGPWSQWGIFAEVTAQEFSNSIGTQVIEPQCAALPVKLSSFTAVRSRSKVLLEWETVQEENSLGFDVQRKIGNEPWTSIGYVASKASGGFSNSPLDYELTDINTNKGVTQYRLKQIEINYKETYSVIRAVRGEGQFGKTIAYPNPSGDGKVNIVFEDFNVTREVLLLDMSGKTLKKWKNITNNNIQIENLGPGVYALRIVDTETGDQDVQKLVVQRR